MDYTVFAYEKPEAAEQIHAKNVNSDRNSPFTYKTRNFPINKIQI